MATLLRWCENADIELNDILLPGSLIGLNGTVNGARPIVGDWEIVTELSRWIEATNGLQYKVFEVRHRHLEERRGRGKLYDMSGLSDRDRIDLAEHLKRHPKVCHEVGPHPRIADNITALPDPNGRDWWVIDRWIEGRTLAEVLNGSRLEGERLAQTMRGIADGLVALHRHGILRRELSPAQIIVRAENNIPVLTDFELAKMLGNWPTVVARSDWGNDPYRAPEVAAGGEDLGPEIDVYSWGRILVHAATGSVPEVGGELAALEGVRLPKSVREIAVAAVQPPRSKRPHSMEEVIRAIRSWK
ncbi:MAG: protein kinase [Pirellulales bacterium]|nr:protein kinase [Pirellulales bacterium]